MANGLVVNGAIDVGAGNGLTVGTLFATETQTWSGSGEVLFGGNGSNQLIANGSSTMVFTIAAPCASTVAAG